MLAWTVAERLPFGTTGGNWWKSPARTTNEFGFVTLCGDSACGIGVNANWDIKSGMSGGAIAEKNCDT